MLLQRENPGALCTPFHVSPSSHTHECGNRILAALVCRTIRSFSDFMITVWEEFRGLSHSCRFLPSMTESSSWSSKCIQLRSIEYILIVIIMKSLKMRIHHVLNIYYIQHLHVWKIDDSYNQYISKNWPATFTVGTSGHQCYGRLERCLSPASRVAGAIFSTWMWMGLLLLINKKPKACQVGMVQKHVIMNCTIHG